MSGCPGLFCPCDVNSLHRVLKESDDTIEFEIAPNRAQNSMYCCLGVIPHFGVLMCCISACQGTCLFDSVDICKLHRSGELRIKKEYVFSDKSSSLHGVCYVQYKVGKMKIKEGIPTGGHRIKVWTRDPATGLFAKHRITKRDTAAIPSDKAKLAEKLNRKLASWGILVLPPKLAAKGLVAVLPAGAQAAMPPQMMMMGAPGSAPGMPGAVPMYNMAYGAPGASAGPGVYYPPPQQQGYPGTGPAPGMQYPPPGAGYGGMPVPGAAMPAPQQPTWFASALGGQLGAIHSAPPTEPALLGALEGLLGLLRSAPPGELSRPALDAIMGTCAGKQSASGPAWTPAVGGLYNQCLQVFSAPPVPVMHVH